MKSVSVGLFQQKNGIFYTIKRTGGKQQWRSLETTDKIEALKKLVFQFDTTSTLAQLEPQQNFPTFKSISEQWLKSISHTIKLSTYEWRRYCLLNLFKKLLI